MAIKLGLTSYDRSIYGFFFFFFIEVLLNSYQILNAAGGTLCKYFLQANPK